MGATKSEEFSVKDNRVAKFAKALSHPARVAILKFLIQQQSCICGDIVNELPLSQSTVSQHLKELKSAGLVKGDIEGASVCYCIDPKEWQEAKKYINELFGSYKEIKDKKFNLSNLFGILLWNAHCQRIGSNRY
jgi:DNA-binding transcriptional ArsR family regulator